MRMMSYSWLMDDRYIASGLIDGSFKRIRVLINWHNLIRIAYNVQYRDIQLCDQFCFLQRT